MELENPQHTVHPIGDPRPKMPEPPPVRLGVVEDAQLEAPAGLERELDGFYVDLLKFERGPETPGRIVYRAENADLVLQVVERPGTREDYRAVLVEVPHFQQVVLALNELGIDYEWQRGIAVGQQALLVRDPAGNYLSITTTNAVR